MKMLALLAASLLAASSTTHGHTVGKPDLVVAAASATLTCSGANRTYSVSVTVANHGSAPSPQRPHVAAVWVQDGAAPAGWMGSAGLPAIEVNGSTVVNVDLVRQGSGSANVPKMPLEITLNKGHWIDESDFSNDSGTIASLRSVSCLTSASALHVTHGPIGLKGPTPHPSPSGIIVQPVKGLPFKLPTPTPAPPNFIPAPHALTYTTNPSVCVTHVGLAGAFICPTVIAQTGLLLLIWSWAPCHNAHCVQQIVGFHIYSVTTLNLMPVAGLTTMVKHPLPYAGFKRTLVDTQTDPSMTLRGISPFSQGECFVVTAYTSSHESDASNTYCVGQSAFVAAPWDVRYIQNYTTCNTVFGSAGYQQCAGYLSANHLVLYWNWNPCGASGCVSASGYNVYQTGGTFVTQQSNAAIHGADVGPYKVGTCYIVRAYHSTILSDASSPFCVTSQMVPTPPPATPAPAPMHVDIVITDDSFPSNTIIHVGGSVTWHNQDTDEHNVVSSDSEIVGDLPPGETFTYTFPRTGSIPYHCDFHPGMNGTITVVSH
jgi:plastocyanin